jgi:hypothetical protein
VLVKFIVVGMRGAGGGVGGSRRGEVGEEDAEKRFRRKFFLVVGRQKCGKPKTVLRIFRLSVENSRCCVWKLARDAAEEFLIDFRTSPKLLLVEKL